MLRRTLTIFSLIGLLLSVGLWGLSYWVVTYRFNSGDIGRLMFGAVDWLEPGTVQRQMWKSIAVFDPRSELHVVGFDNSETNWTPSRQTYVTGMVRTIIPLWIPTAAFVVFLPIVYLPGRRRRKRKKLGLCLKCGYDLRASKGRCPECGTTMQKSGALGTITHGHDEPGDT